MWDILEIQPTSDIGIIKEAYARLAKKYNPEEYPEEFREIHEAYKKACEYARMMNRLYDMKKKTESPLPAGSSSSEYDFSSVEKESGGEAEPSSGTGDNFDFSSVGGDPHIDDQEGNEEKQEGKEEKQERKEEKHAGFPDEIVAAIVLSAMKCLLDDKNRHDSSPGWNKLFSTDSFRRIVLNTGFRKLASEMLMNEVFPYETAKTVADGFGISSKLLYVSNFPVKECIVRIDPLSGSHNKKMDIHGIKDFVENSFGKFF